jgi:Acyl-CoA synthetases (AMP-forming)/AMP-acid ligases II
LSSETIDTHCREQLAGFKCPRTIVVDDEIPRTASGSIDRPAVREILAAADDAEPVVESAETDAGGGESDAETAADTGRRPPLPMSTAEDGASSPPADSEPIPDAESIDDEPSDGVTDDVDDDSDADGVDGDSDADGVDDAGDDTDNASETDGVDADDADSERGDEAAGDDPRST